MLLRILLLLVACLSVRIAAMHVVFVRSGPRVPSVQDVSFCPFDAYAFASVLVAMAERAMEGVLGAGGAPSAQCLQAPQAPARGF